MKLRKINDPLIEWFRENKRYMPWREQPTFYYVWLSEVMLQQTRVDTVITYFERFIKEVPTIEDLASISDDKLLKLWEGLGYYNRARNLKIAAQQIICEFDGIPPKTYDDIIQLKGIGAYTAGAIMSIVYNKRIAAVDGNVLRVLTRVLELPSDITKEKTKKEFKSLIEENMPENARDYTQGLMELGAIICIPNGLPKCEICPLKTYCGAYQNDTISKYPVKKLLKKRRIEKLSVFLFVCQNRVLIEKRNDDGLLKGLYQFPNIQGHFSKVEMKYFFDEMGYDTSKLKKLPMVTHVFSHLEWHMQGYCVPVDHENEGLWVTLEELKHQYSIPTAFKPYVKELEGILNASGEFDKSESL